MPASHSFKSAAYASSDVVTNPVEVEFDIDGVDLVASPPSSGQVALFIADQADTTNQARKINGMLEFLETVLREEDWEFIHDGMKSGQFDIDLLGDIVDMLAEEWTGNPTSSAPASSSRQRSTGKQSTAKRSGKASTSSTSR